MHLRLVAVGERQPGWVDTAFTGYVDRLPRVWKFNVHVLSPSRRRQQGNAGLAKQEESESILHELRPGERSVMLDESGRQLNSQEFAQTLAKWQAEARDVCFIIGGPDGIDAASLQKADFCWSLSRLTLPHGLARVVFAEQLYRASTLLAGHPYHRG